MGELAAEFGVGWTGESYPLPGEALEAVRQSSPRQESVETVSATKDRVPLRRSGAPAKQRRGAEAHPAGAVELLRMRVAALRAGEERASQDSEVAMSNGHGDMPVLLSRLAGGAETRRRCRRHDHRRGECSVSGSDVSTTSDESGAELGMRDDTRVRQVARTIPGSLAASTIVSFARQVGYAQGAGELEAAANIQRLPVSHLDRALLAQAETEVSSVCRKRAENLGR